LTNKIGYATLADGVVSTSFKNVLLAAYSCASTSSTSSTSDIADQSELPGLTSFSKWDNKDGRTGRCYWIGDETYKTGKRSMDGSALNCQVPLNYLSKISLLTPMPCPMLFILSSQHLMRILCICRSSHLAKPCP
jgi:hypothetical protein